MASLLALTCRRLLRTAAGCIASVAAGHARTANSRSLAHRRHPGFSSIAIGAAAFKALLTFRVRDHVRGFRTTAVPSCELELSTLNRHPPSGSRRPEAAGRAHTQALEGGPTAESKHPRAARDQRDADSPGPGPAATAPRTGARGGARLRCLSRAGRHKHPAPGPKTALPAAASMALRRMPARRPRIEGQP